MSCGLFFFTISTAFDKALKVVRSIELFISPT